MARTRGEPRAAEAQDAPRLPSLIVFGQSSPLTLSPALTNDTDLDYTLWPFWVDTNVRPPIEPNPDTDQEGRDQDDEPLRFYPDVPSILRELSAAGVKLGIASRTSDPQAAEALLKILRIPEDTGDVPSDVKASLFPDGTADVASSRVRAWSLFDGVRQIYPGNKVNHFKALRRSTGIKYWDMLFFDDEHRNKNVEELGVTMRLVPNGVTWDEVLKGVERWRREYSPVTR